MHFFYSPIKDLLAIINFVTFERGKFEIMEMLKSNSTYLVYKTTGNIQIIFKVLEKERLMQKRSTCSPIYTTQILY